LDGTVTVAIFTLVLSTNKVMRDIDLAKLYQVETKRLNEQVKRNADRFPEDFMFQLTDEEWVVLSRKLRPQKKAAEEDGIAPIGLPNTVC
jgi:hypothetical protein